MIDRVWSRARAVVMVMGLGLAGATSALAQPAFVGHTPAQQVFGEPSGITMREPDVPREGDFPQWWVKIGPSFTYSNVCIYFTTDGSEPVGSLGVPSSPFTFTLRNSSGGLSFVRNEPNGFGGNDDWWRANIPLLPALTEYNRTIKYKISAWQTTGQGAPVGSEVFAANGATFTYTNKLAWPGAGAGQANPNVGYPPVSFWKEEAFLGNTFTAAMLDQNGSWWDMYFPTPGGVQGVGTRNEGYSEGGDTFPALLSSEKRGQMHLNMATVGLRIDGLTHWLSNPNGVSYSNVTQSYASDTTNSVRTAQRFTQGGRDISVTQFDFAPAGIAFPSGLAGTGEQKHMLVKRMLLRNNAATAATVNVYMYMDPALNGGDTYDVMFWDASRGAMTVYDKTRRTVFGTGPFISPPEEYNVSTFSGYEKNIALYLSAAMKVLPTVGASTGTAASDSWRDTSGDNGQGWIGQQVTLPPGVDVEVNFMLAGAHFRPDPITDPIPGSDGVYDNEIVPMLDWFANSSQQAALTTTDSYWTNWLAQGTTIDTPDDRYDRLMQRGLLATAIHQDGVHGGIVAGYHNGAYYYVWPRDAMWAAVTLARTGHVPEAKQAIDWMRIYSYRDFEPWGRKGFWKQKCSTDGFTIWGAPQIDGTAVFPWAVQWVDDMTGDTSYLNLNYPAVRDSVLAMTTDSQDSRLRWEEAFNLTYSNNLWEDSYDTFIYSNANMHRGLTDAAKIATTLGFTSDASDATTRAGWVKSGLDARLDWDGENTDASQLGIVYPFEVYSPTDFRSTRIVDRINGVRTKFNNTFPTSEPLVNFANFFNDGHGWTNLINRYWGDGYWGNGSSASPWGAGPWFLTTMWYGNYYALRQDFTLGTSDIDNHKLRLDLLLDKVGPMGLGAEQISPKGIPGQGFPRSAGSMLYPGQNDFVLQTAWPNAWESMSFFTDSLMAFLDYKPDARAQVMRMEPKLPGMWQTMTYRNLEVANTTLGGFHSVHATIARTPTGEVHTFTNATGAPLAVQTVLRADPNVPIATVTRNGVPIPFTLDPATGRVSVGAVALATGSNAVTEIRVNIVTAPVCDSLDFNNDTLTPDSGDLDDFLAVLAGGPGACSTFPTPGCNDIDFNNDGFSPDSLDLDAFISRLGGGPCLQ